MVTSRKPGKQRKAHFNAPMHTKRKRVTARLQLDKPDERFAGVRSVTIRTGDTRPRDPWRFRKRWKASRWKA